MAEAAPLKSGARRELDGRSDIVFPIPLRRLTFHESRRRAQAHDTTLSISTTATYIETPLAKHLNCFRGRREESLDHISPTRQA
jgi:hypothetical protein